MKKIKKQVIIGKVGKRMSNFNKDVIKNIFLIFLGLWNLLSLLYFVPIIIGFILGNIIFHENWKHFAVNIGLMIVFCIFPLIALLKRLREYRFGHFLVMGAFVLVGVLLML